MPTNKARLQITLSQEAEHVVTELARLSSCSKASVVTGLLESAIPGLLQAIELMRAAEGATAKVHQHIAADLLQGMRALEAERNNLIEAIGHATKDMTAGKGPGRRLAGSAGHRQGRTGATPAPVPSKALERPLKKGEEVPGGKPIRPQAHANTNGVPGRSRKLAIV